MKKKKKIRKWSDIGTVLPKGWTVTQLRDEIPRTIDVEFAAGDVTIRAAAPGKRVRRFEMLAYSGRAMRPKMDPPIDAPIVIDLAGLDLSKQKYPALRDHNSRDCWGHTTRVETDGRRLVAEGVVSHPGPVAAEILEAHDSGFPFQVSVGSTVGKLEFVPRGKSAHVNGRTIDGPCHVARACRLRELSVLSVAADDDTAVRIAATQRTNMKTKKTSSAARVRDDDTDELRDDGEMILSGERDDATDGMSIERENAIYRACGVEHADIAAQAIEQKWDDSRIRARIRAAELQAGLPRASSTHRSGNGAPKDGAVLEAAVCMTLGLGGDGLSKRGYDQRTLNEAQGKFRNGIGLQELLLYAAQANGYTGGLNVKANLRDVLHYSMQAAQFSTISLPNILSNSVNQIMLDGFTFGDSSWREIAARRSVSDFKESASLRLTGNATYEELPPDGEIRHGTLGEEAYTIRARTFAKMYGVSRVDLVNDNLGALREIARMLGRGALLAINNEFWTEFKDNDSFFTSGNGNYLSGADTDLSLTSLAAALLKFRQQVDADGNILGLTPRVLLVPPHLESTALELTSATSINTGGASTETAVPNANIWAGRFKVVVSDYLTDETEWYLLADPRELAVMQVAFLNGREAPQVDQSDADFNQLGLLMRGWIDFAVGKFDPRAGLKMNGAS